MTGPELVVPTVPAKRRAPFADNPSVGVRGTRTQLRILQAALEAFGQVGYHACRVEAITEAAGCSRPSFYQYFSSKEDLFRRLAGHVAKLLSAIAEAGGPIGADRAGRDALRAWLDDYSDIYDDYTAVFNGYAAARGSDDAVASGASRVARRQLATLAGRIDHDDAVIDPEHVTPFVLHMVLRTNRYRHLLGEVEGEVTLDRARVNDALADVLHRAMFGPRSGVNVATGPQPARRRRRGRSSTEGLAVAPARRGVGPTGLEMRARLLAAARQVFAERGYHETRVNDIAEAAKASHGTFYRYFHNKHDVFVVIAAEAGRHIAEAIGQLPEVPPAAEDPALVGALRQWVDTFAATYAAEGPIIRVWVEAMSPENELGTYSIGAVEGVRRRLADFIAPRGFGDPDAESLALLALIERESWSGGAPAGPGPEHDLVTGIIARGFLGVGGSRT